MNRNKSTHPVPLPIADRAYEGPPFGPQRSTLRSIAACCASATQTFAEGSFLRHEGDKVEDVGDGGVWRAGDGAVDEGREGVVEVECA